VTDELRSLEAGRVAAHQVASRLGLERERIRFGGSGRVLGVGLVLNLGVGRGQESRHGTDAAERALEIPAAKARASDPRLRSFPHAEDRTQLGGERSWFRHPPTFADPRPARASYPQRPGAARNHRAPV